MHILMTHPVHGTKTAISEMEVAHDKTQGWRVYEPEPIVAVEHEPEIVAEEEIIEHSQEPTIPRRGRPRKKE